MTNAEFKTKLAEAFKTHMFMKDRSKHTINELLHRRARELEKK